jgi:hypothetical protein
MCLEVVVVLTYSCKVLQARRPAFREGDHPVVDLEAARDLAPRDDANRVPLLEGGTEMCRHRAAEVADGPYVDSVRYHQLEEVVAEDPLGD